MTTLDGTRVVIADCMDEILRCFKPGAKITVVVRASGYPDGSRDLIMTDDDMAMVIKAIEMRMKAEAAPT
jgi:hypothetical protein